MVIFSLKMFNKLKNLISLNMKRPIIATIILAFFANSCTTENLDRKDFNTQYINITGDNMYTYSEGKSRAETINKLSENDCIVFSSNGGIIADKEILVYKDNRWSGLKNKTWEENNENADYCAIHPVMEVYDENSLYLPNNELKDIIYCKSTGEYGKEINLSFKHMFAKIQINIDNELNNLIEEIRMSVPLSVENINTQTGEITTNNKAKNIVLSKNETARYDIFIPEGNSLNIPFEIITTDGKTYSATVNHSDYISGYEYVCNVKYNNGIYTKEDFIAFSYLINGKPYNGRKLDEFYILKDGKRVFNLYADLEFTKEETSLIQSIGTETNNFDNIFDGNNHTISGIYYDSGIDRRFHIALFGFTTKNAIIRNLGIENFTFVETTYASFKEVGFIVMLNKGIIDNCYAKNATISINNNNKNISKYASAICAVNEGYIINCNLESLNIIEDGGKIGGICAVNKGHILNCCVNSKVNVTYKKKEVSAICLQNNKIMKNIYTYNYSPYNFLFENPDEENNGYARNIFLNKKYYQSDKPSLVYIPYYDTPEDYIRNTEQLNNWIETTGKEKYPNLTFRLWNSDGTSHPRMQ